MAVVDRNSDVIANIVAVPSVRNNAITSGGDLKQAIGIVSPANNDTEASVHRFVRVPSNARISDVKIAAADATTAGAYNIGFYRTEEDGGAVVDADALAAAFDLSGGPFYWSSVLLVGVVTIAESNKPAWELAGLSSDPGGYLDIAGTISTTFNGGPTSVGLKVDYVV
jgi:hypothetical protein